MYEAKNNHCKYQTTVCCNLQDANDHNLFSNLLCTISVLKHF